MLSHGKLSLYEQKENIRLQFLLVAGAIANIVWPLAILHYDPSHVEILWARGLIVGICLLLVGWSVAVPPSRKNRDWYVLIAATVITFYSHYIIALNGWDAHYLIGLFLTSFVAYAIISRPWAAIAYSLVLLGTMAATDYFYQLESAPALPLLWTITVILVGLLVNFMRSQLLIDMTKAELESASVLSSMAEGVFVFGSDGRIVNFNPMALTILDVNPDQLNQMAVGNQKFKLFDERGEIFPAELLPWVIALETGTQVLGFAAQVTKSDGSKVHLLINAKPAFNNLEDRPAYVVVTILDVTALREAEFQVQAQQAKLISSARLTALGEMAAGIAHEINNPLAIIAMNVELIKGVVNQEPVDRAVIHKKLESVSKTIKRIVKIIRGMRLLVRESSNDPFESVEVSRLIEDTLELLGERIKSESIDLEVNVARDMMIECRSGQIAQILTNLIQNAVDELTQVQLRRLKVETRDVGSEIAIIVSDSGRGIPSSISDRIWQPFFTTKEPNVGTGLGLSISRSIAQQHRGQLEIERVGSMTRLILTLPKRQAVVGQESAA